MTFEMLRTQLASHFQKALERGEREIEVSSWQLHREAGANAATDDDLRTCCAVLEDEQCVDDEVVFRTDRFGTPPSLTVRYRLPR